MVMIMMMIMVMMTGHVSSAALGGGIVEDLVTGDRGSELDCCDCYW